MNKLQLMRSIQSTSAVMVGPTVMMMDVQSKSAVLAAVFTAVIVVQTDRGETKFGAKIFSKILT